MDQYTQNNNITIGDVADALGISKTTVSRAISGKGRISEQTREKVMDYISKHNYKPNPMARGLAEQRTYNICWIMPGEASATDLLFFQRCMIGIVETAIVEGYDILITMNYEDDISQIERVVENKKIDGAVLGRTLVSDETVRFLKASGVPFVAIGSTPETDVVQIDNDHINACKEITSILLMKGMKKVVLIGGDTGHVVNQTRQKGFELAFKENKIKLRDDQMYLNNINQTDIEKSVDAAIRSGADCLICMDDRICDTALMKLRKEGLRVPQDMKLASFYNSPILENAQPSITSLQYGPKELGVTACKTLIAMLHGEEVPQKTMLGYEVLLKESTKM